MSTISAASSVIARRTSSAKRPEVVSTWNHGRSANEAAWQVLSSGGKAIDAVEAGFRVPDADPNANHFVANIGLLELRF